MILILSVSLPVFLVCWGAAADFARKDWFTNLYRTIALPISAVFPLRYIAR